MSTHFIFYFLFFNVEKQCIRTLLFKLRLVREERGKKIKKKKKIKKMKNVKDKKDYNNILYYLIERE